MVVGAENNAPLRICPADLAVMESGRIILNGPVAEVLKSSREMERVGVNCPRVVTLADRLRGRKDSTEGLSR